MATILESKDIVQTFGDLYKDHQEYLLDKEPSFLKKAREEAIESFTSTGIPGPKHENYKYIDAGQFFGNGYRKYIMPKQISFSVSDIFRCDIPELDTHVILLVNGYYYQEQGERLKTYPGGVIAGSFAEACKVHPEIVSEYFNRYASESKEGFAALNTALARDGLFLHVPAGVTADKPFQVINILLSDEDIMVQHRNLFILGEKAQVNVIVCDHTLSPWKFLTNSVLEAHLHKEAVLELTRMQNEHNNSVQFTHTFVMQEEASRVNSNVISLHGGTIRNNLYVRLNGEYADVNALGLSLTDGSQHVDNFTWIEHAKPHCTSNQLYKNILNDVSTGVFTGRILVHKDAQKTQAYQRNNNILLTDDARMRSKPQLEIYADDVKCSHGATVGQIDPNAMFYLRSRGIGEDEARLLLMFAFAHEIIGGLSTQALRDRVDELVNKRLRGELSRCNNCAMHCC
jgi:Fe-S cluster assembly protein SufD